MIGRHQLDAARDTTDAGEHDRVLIGAQRPQSMAHYDQDPSTEDHNTTFVLPGAALGLGMLIGIIIGSKMTFHSPVRRRRYP
jgi:hypothetical protein